MAAALGATFATAFLSPYNAVTGGVNDFLHRIAPGMFLASEPQRVAVSANPQVGATGEGSVMTIKIGHDG